MTSLGLLLFYGVIFWYLWLLVPIGCFIANFMGYAHLPYWWLAFIPVLIFGAFRLALDGLNFG